MRKAKKKYPKEILDVIPNDYYCHGDYANWFMRLINRKKYDYICPFWFKINGLPEQECGYCALIGKSDYEMNREKHDLIMTYFKNGKTRRKLIRCGPDNPSSFSLLWDKCKEVGCPKYV